MAKLIFAFSFFLMQQVFGAECQNRNNLVFIGNPGVGKSTLINSLRQSNSAPAGVSLGGGLTQYFDEYKHHYEGKDLFLLDTPGLADMKRQKEAAIEIEKALKLEGEYKLFFVMTLEGGRLRADDIATKEVVLKAIKHEGLKFNVIINKVGKKEKTALSDLKQREEFLSLLNSGNFKTDRVFYIDLDEDVDREKSQFYIPTPALKSFIYTDSNTIKIEKKEVEKIQVDQFEELKEAHKAQQEELTRVKADLQAALNKPAQIIYYQSPPQNNNDDDFCTVQ